MSIQHYPLYEFITRVHCCYETTSVKEVLSFFEQDQHRSQLVVLTEQHMPLCLLDATNLLALVIYGKQDELGNTHFDDWNLPISCLDEEFIQPIQILSSSLSLEQFGAKLRNRKLPVNSQNWLLVDEYGKFLGILDSCKLLGHLAFSKNKKEVAATLGQVETGYQQAGNSISVLPRNLRTNINSDNNYGISYADAKNQIHDNENRGKNQLEYKYVAQLLKRLPWALMLETDTKEVVSRNQLWYAKLGELRDQQGL